MGKQGRSQGGQAAAKAGQAILSEHTMILFVVIAAVVAMTVFVQRAFEARIHDARNFMINAVADSNVCDANCLSATGNISYEYEPYYTNMIAQQSQQSHQSLTATTGKTTGIGGVYGQKVNEATETNAVTVQLPPEVAR